MTKLKSLNFYFCYYLKILFTKINIYLKTEYTTYIAAELNKCYNINVYNKVNCNPTL